MPRVILIAGPNGAGKSTSAPALIPEGVPYINADEIAKELARDPNVVNKDMEASRLLLAEWDRHANEKSDFAIETTLASKSLAPKINRLKAAGYEFHLYFFWLPSVDLAIARVAERVRSGGHHIPEDVIRRRYEAGIRNFFEIYRSIADEWLFFNNLKRGHPALIASGQLSETAIIKNDLLWQQLEASLMDKTVIKETRSAYSPIDPLKMERAVQRAIRAAVLEHKRIGNPIAEWRDGKVVIVQPEDIVVGDLDEDEPATTQ